MNGNKLARDLVSLCKRINGLSIWGVQWKNGVDSREEMKRLVDELSNRRVSFSSYAWEVPNETVMSVLEIRRHIVETMKNVNTRSDAHKLLRVMAAACLEYLDNRRIVDDRKELELALYKLRAVFGACLLVIEGAYQLDITGQIRDIIPDNRLFKDLRLLLMKARYAHIAQP